MLRHRSTSKWTLGVAVSLTALGLTLAAHPAKACEECGLKGRTIIGQAKMMGSGVAYSWVKLNSNKKPVSFGVTLTEGALESLPVGPPPGETGWEYELAMPKEAGDLAATHVGMDWNPSGHEPKGVYDKPHFDFHFYTIASEDRKKITAKGEDAKRCLQPVATGGMPEGYFTAPGTEVKMMGAHWLDKAAPEFNGKPFTHTFLYCSYDGNMIGFEPMIAKSFLESKPNVTAPIKLPAVYPKPGLYPTTYTVKHDPARREYIISMEGLQMR